MSSFEAPPSQADVPVWDLRGLVLRRLSVVFDMFALLKEMQALSLDANVVSEEGVGELAEEEDDLLQAAQDLGMDLTEVRADDSNGAADETVEAEADATADGSGDTKEAGVENE